MEPSPVHVQGLSVLNECADRGTRAVISETGHASCLHFDDGVFAGTVPDITDALMHESAAALEDVGPPRLMILDALEKVHPIA